MMQRRFGRTWSTRAVAVLAAAILVWTLLLVIERQGGAEAQSRPASAAATARSAAAATRASATSAAALAKVATEAAAQQATSAAVDQADQATQQLAQAGLPPAALARVCAALLRARAILVALGPRGRPGLIIIDRLIARYGCRNISNVPPPPPRCIRAADGAAAPAANPVRFIRIDIDSPPVTASRIVAGCGIVAGPTVAAGSRPFLTCSAALVLGGVQLTYSITSPDSTAMRLECNVTVSDAAGNNQLYIFIFTVDS